MSLGYAYCSVSVSPLRSEPSDSSEMVSQLLFGEVVTIKEKNQKWWKVQSYADNYVGWIDPKQVRILTLKEVNRWLDGISYERAPNIQLHSDTGILSIPKGAFVPFQFSENFLIGENEYTYLGIDYKYPQKNPFELAQEYLNVPYLWGGKTPHGIDCSGLTQSVFRFLEINLPRDASQQVDFGTLVTFQDAKIGDLAFFENENNKITHVGILDGKEKIIHASGYVRISSINEKGILDDDEINYTHFLHSIKRMF